MELLREHIENTHHEPGVFRFAAHRQIQIPGEVETRYPDTYVPGRMMVVEVFKDWAAWDAHYKEPYMERMMEEGPGLVEDLKVSFWEPAPMGDPTKGSV